MRRLHAVDAAGFVVVSAAVGWTLVAASAHSGSRPVPTVAAYVGLAVAVIGGRSLRRWLGTGDRLSLAAAALGGLLVGWLGRFEIAGAGGPPLGYGNANGAAFGMVALVAVAARAAVRHPPPAARRAVTVVVLAALAATAASGSAGATAATAAGIATAAGVAALGHHRRAAVPLVAAGLLLALGATFALAKGAGPEELAADSFGTRIALWREAAAVAADHPGTGVGPGRFQEVNPFAADEDLRRAHSIPLQLAAEQGAVGLTLLLALAGWALAALWSARRDRLVAVGAGVVLAAGLQACWDWVLADPAVSLPAALVVGFASRHPRLPRPESPG